MEAARRRRRNTEQTTSGNVGGFTVPLGRPLRRTFPSTTKGKGKKDREEYLRRALKGWGVGVGAIDNYEIPDAYKGILSRAEEQLGRLRRRRTS